jgi:hypothetical protein
MLENHMFREDEYPGYDPDDKRHEDNDYYYGDPEQRRRRREQASRYGEDERQRRPERDDARYGRRDDERHQGQRREGEHWRDREGWDEGRRDYGGRFEESDQRGRRDKDWHEPEEGARYYGGRYEEREQHRGPRSHHRENQSYGSRPASRDRFGVESRRRYDEEGGGRDYDEYAQGMFGRDPQEHIYGGRRDVGGMQSIRDERDDPLRGGVQDSERYRTIRRGSAGGYREEMERGGESDRFDEERGYGRRGYGRGYEAEEEDDWRRSGRGRPGRSR